jgi:four helix bundle protein
MGWVTEVYRLTQGFPRDEMFGLTSQTRRAASSVPLNIAEGAGCESAREFSRFLEIGLRSTYETVTALEIARRLRYCDDAEVKPLLSEADELAAMLVGLTRTVQNRASATSLHETLEPYTTDCSDNDP